MKKINRNPDYGGIKSDDIYYDNKSIELSSIDIDSVSKIDKDTSNIQSFIRSKDTASFLSINEYERHKAQEAIDKACEEERKKQDARKIEEALDLSDVNTNIFAPKRDRIVSYRRTFGHSESKKRKAKTISTVSALVVLVITVIIMLIFA